MDEYDRDTIIEAAREAAQKTGRPLSRADFERITGISQYHIYRHFPEGGWTEIKRLAGLERHPMHNKPLSDEELLKEFHEVACSLGSIPTWATFAAHASISADVVRRRFGGSDGTLKHYQAWLEGHDPNSPLLNEIRERLGHSKPVPEGASEPEANIYRQTWDKSSGPEFGAPINFRGLRHAPINEQGVVFLFGMVCDELGYIVEAVHASYPDCEAKRCVDHRRQRWQRVRIEFEFRSSSFRAHGHDPAHCDVIVCWEHDWFDCPLEVVELKQVITELKT